MRSVQNQKCIFNRHLIEVLKGRTSVVIAHSLVYGAALRQIIVIKDKHLTRTRHPSTIIKKDGLYANLFKIQSGEAAKLKEWDLVRYNFLYPCTSSRKGNIYEYVFI